jgi:hypothetical protein
LRLDAEGLVTPLDKYLLEVREREGKATAGPWKHAVGTRYIVSDAIGGDRCHLPSEGICRVSKWSNEVDLAEIEFIAHARTDIPRLVKMVEVARFAMKRACGGCAYCTLCSALAELDRLAGSEK